MTRHLVYLMIVAASLSALGVPTAAAQVTVRAQRCELVETSRIPAAGATDLELGRIAALAVDGFGHLYVSDQQGPDGHIIRSFTTGGRFLRAIGRVGSGPAEYRALDGGLTTLADGRLVVRDAANGRFTIFDSLGAPSAQWRLIPTYGFEALQRERDGVVSYVAIRPAEGEDPTKWGEVAVRISASGKVIDSLAIPTAKLPEAVADMRSGGNINRIPVPLAPRAYWAYRPGRGFVTVQSDKPWVMLHDASGVKRVQWMEEREPPPAFARGEREAVVERFQANALNAVRVRGPAIPDAKPYFDKPWAAADGTTWVLMHATGVPRSEEDDRGRRVTRWRAPLTFGIIAPDGRSVRVATGPTLPFSSRIAPAILGDTVWVASEDGEGLPIVVRLEVRC